MEITKVEKVEKYIHTVIGYRCDICDKTVDGEKLPGDWCQVREFADYDYGDNHDVTYDICSKECFMIELEQWHDTFADSSYCTIQMALNPEFVKKLLK